MYLTKEDYPVNYEPLKDRYKIEIKIIDSFYEKAHLNKIVKGLTHFSTVEKRN